MTRRKSPGIQDGMVLLPGRKIETLGRLPLRPFHVGRTLENGVPHFRWPRMRGTSGCDDSDWALVIFADRWPV